MEEISSPKPEEKISENINENKEESPEEKATSGRKRSGWDDDVKMENETSEKSDERSKLESDLTEDQKMRLEQARAFAKQQTEKYLQSPANVINPTIAAALTKKSSIGNEARTLSLLCKIYVGSIFYDLTEQNIRSVFNPFGSIRAVTLKIDPTTGKHNGYCFIDYDLPEAAFLAIERMKGADLSGRKLKVGRPFNYNDNLIQTLPKPSPSRIYIANVNENLTEEHLESLFSPFGEVEQCALIPDPITRKHKNCGFIEFKNEDSATSAVQNMNGFVIGDQAFQVRKAIVGGPMPEGMKALDKMPVLPTNIPADVWETANSISSNIGASAPSQINSISIQQQNENNQINKQEETVSLEENMSISASQRLSIMQKLARRDKESTVVLLENMVTADEIDDSLQSEITSECSKYGDVLKVIVWIVPESITNDVRIFIQFDSSEAAVKANNELNGRYFGGKQLVAKLYDLDKFNNEDYSQ